MDFLALIYNTLGMVKESILLDKEILASDANHHRSYARLISSHIKSQEYSEARKYGKILKDKFDESIVNKYQEYFELLDFYSQSNNESIQSIKTRDLANMKIKEDADSEEAKDNSVGYYIYAGLGLALTGASLMGLYMLKKKS